MTDLTKNVQLIIVGLLVATALLATFVILQEKRMKSNQQFSLKKGGLLLVYNVAVFLLCFYPSQKNIWHTIYVGFGAYPNPYGIRLDDGDAYRLYEQKYNVKFTFDAYGNYYDPGTIDAYKETTWQAALTILRDNPALLVRNAALNFFESFSVGYLNQWPRWCNYLSALIGLVVCLFLLKNKYYVYLAGIVLGSAAYALYYPPIPAYMYGSYVFLLVALIDVLDKHLPETLLSRSDL